MWGKASDHKVCIVICGLFLICGALHTNTQWMTTLDNLWTDLLIRQRAELQPASERIVVIDVDDVSLNAMAPVAGNWPWPRAVHAELVELLQQEKPAAVVFDILFADPDIFNPDSDQYFAEVLAGFKNVYLPILHLQTDADGLFPKLDQYPATVPLIKPSEKGDTPHAGLVLPKALPENVWRLGTINFKPDADGVGRRYDSIYPIGDWGLLSLPAKLAQDLEGIVPVASSHILDWYAGGIEPYPRHSYYQVYRQLSEAKPFRKAGYFSDKIVVIGSTAAGLHDIQVSPVSSAYPGVFILATAIDNFIQQNFLKQVSPLIAWLSFSLIFCLLMFLLLHIKPLVPASIVVLCLLCSALFGSYLALMQFALIVPVVGWLLLIILASGIFYFYRFLQQQREMRKTVDIFGRFLDPKVVSVLLEQGLSEHALKGKNTRVTILFTDIREFTHLSEYRSATEIVDLLNHYFSRQVGVIFQHSGTLDKFIGDAIMAFWGEPVEDPQQEISAVSAALEMIEQMKQFRREYGLFDFDIGIGIHTGEVVVGAIGTQSRYDYTAIGDAVNLASRIEGLTKETGFRLLVSEETRNACGEAFDFDLIGDYKVKGRKELVTIYQPRRLSDDL